MDESKIDELKYEIAKLNNELDLEIRKVSQYSSSDILSLRNLKKETEALAQFVGIDSENRNYIPFTEQLFLANQRIGATIAYVSKDKHCVDIISINIGTYIAYVAENKSTRNYTVSYKWSSADGSTSADGFMGLPSSRVRHIYNNRTNPIQRTIIFSELNCVEF